MRNYLRNGITIALLLAVFPGLASVDAPVRVRAYGEHRGNNIVYHYMITNNGTKGFNNFVIGSEYDSAQNETWPELGKLPVGWRYGRQGEVGTEIILDPASTTQPSGWAPSVYGKQDIDFFYLKWRGGAQGVEPGQTLSGFSVTVPKGKDPNLFPMSAGSQLKFINGHFTVGLPLGPEIHGSIERQDTTAPSLNITVTPGILWPPNGKSIPITVTISVSDDYDAASEVKLESVVANELLAASDVSGAQIGTDDRQFSLVAKRAGANKDGRIYTITYSATDASGNKASATANVLVPHDKGK